MIFEQIISSLEPKGLVVHATLHDNDDNFLPVMENGVRAATLLLIRLLHPADLMSTDRPGSARTGF